MEIVDWRNKVHKKIIFQRLHMHTHTYGLWINVVGCLIGKIVIIIRLKFEVFDP
jgi:hypothetical protein